MPPKNNIFSRIGNQIVVCCWLYTEVCSDKKWWRWGDLERMLCMWEKRRLCCKAVGIDTTQLTGQHTPRYYHQRPPVCGPRRATNAAWRKRQVDSIYWDVTDCGIKCYYTRRLNIHHTVLYYSTGKLAPEKVIVVVPLEQVRKEGSRVSFHCGSE